jgi:cytochrome oxidase Cu insertion factor (SCO1/SenC/PrrC family)
LQAGASYRPIALIGGLIGLMLVGGTITAVAGASGNAKITEKRLAAAGAGATPRLRSFVGASDAAVMGLVRLDGGKAPGFVLLDQHGRVRSLASLDRSRAVVLTFVDNRCRDVCPVLAREMARADARLGARAGQVAFVAINVDVARASVGAGRQFVASETSTLAGMKNFYFLTGLPATLRRVWAAYHVQVEIQPDGAVLHTQAMDFIGPGGSLVGRATPYANERSTGTGFLPAAIRRQWAAGIASEAEHALR